MTSIVRGRVAFVADDDAGRSVVWLDVGGPLFEPIECSRAERERLARHLGDVVAIRVQPAGGPERGKSWPCF